MKYKPPRVGPKPLIPSFIHPEILTHPNIPKPLHGVNPRSILGKEWWDKVRQIAYKKNNYCCWACGISKYNAKYHRWLEAHESYKINYETGEVRLHEIVALCHSCHNYIHDGRLEILLDKKEITPEKYIDINFHGSNILSNAKIVKPDSPRKVAEWGKWHLVLDDKKHYSPYKNILEWFIHYNPDHIMSEGLIRTLEKETI